MKFGKKSLFVALLVVGLLLINYLASSLPWRLDLTNQKIYTLSPGTQALIGKVGEPMTLDFYYSRGANGLPVF